MTAHEKKSRSMADTIVSKLNKIQEKLNACSTPEEKTDVLARAFELYSSETASLEAAHAELLEKFNQLTLESDETNLRLKTKLDELDAVNDYLTSLLYNISEGLIFIDLQGNVTTYNRMAEEIVQVPIAKVIFNSYWEAFEDDFFGFSMRQVLQTKKAPPSSYLTLGVNGKSKQLELDATFVLQTNPPIGASELQGVILLLRDISEIRRLESLESRNDRMKELGEMAAMVAHEIRNPLGGIKGFASLLERDLVDRPDQQQMATYIIEGTDNLNNLVTNVLNYSRPVQTVFESLDFVAFCREILNYVQADKTTPKNIQFCLTSKESTLPIIIDPQLMKGALLNLIINAIQAMPNGGVLSLNIIADSGNVIVEVTDTGIGIPEKNLEKIFSPFFTTKPDGNGFGLSEAHKVIQAHNGSIQVKSKVGEGTTFTIQFPLRTKKIEIAT